jgi:hypothetical protein
MKKKTGQANTQEVAPDQTQKSGQANQEVAPGQTKSGESSASNPNNTSTETTGSIGISAEQRTQVKQIITTTKVEPARVDFSVDVGVAVPSSVTLHPLPRRVVELVPAYESYEYFLLPDGRIVIVQPDTLQVVYILS